MYQYKREINMSEFPTLSEMGISRCHEITHYVLRPDGKARDILRIFYKRKKGSVLPERKTFKFGRSAKMVADSNSRTGSEVFEISPFLLKAVSELDKLVDENHSNSDKLKAMLKHVEQLEKDMKFATGEIKELIKSIQKDI